MDDTKRQQCNNTRNNENQNKCFSKLKNESDTHEIILPA